MNRELLAPETYKHVGRDVQAPKVADGAGRSTAAHRRKKARSGAKKAADKKRDRRERA